MVAIMPSVAPQQTAISRSGSKSIPYVRRYLSTIASRKGLAPHVIAYWFISAAIASAAARLSASGAGKSGKPWARLMAPWLIARRVISRITDSVNLRMRWLRKRARRAVAEVGTFREYENCRREVKRGPQVRNGKAQPAICRSGPVSIERQLGLMVSPDSQREQPYP